MKKEDVKKLLGEEALKKQRALDYLNDLAREPEHKENSLLFIEITKNEATLEILRAQQTRITILREENEADTVHFADCSNILLDSAKKQLIDLMEIRCKIAEEAHKTHEYMQKLYNLSNIKEIDTKIRKFSELSDAFQKISTSLNDEKIAKIISILTT